MFASVSNPRVREALPRDAEVTSLTWSNFGCSTGFPILFCPTPAGRALGENIILPNKSLLVQCAAIQKLLWLMFLMRLLIWAYHFWFRWWKSPWQVAAYRKLILHWCPVLSALVKIVTALPLSLKSGKISNATTTPKNF